MDEDKRRRLVQLLGMMGSAHDGEVLNAARLAQRLIGAMAMTWDEVFSTKGGGHYTEAAVRTVVTEAYEKGFQAGVTKGIAHARKEARAPQPQTSKTAKPRETWQGFARELRDNYEDDLTEWEQGFVESFIARGFYTPTPKQQAIFERMADKCGLECPE